ncbi:MAG: DUF6167 family protein [Actinomycetota bacterium]|nr:DUF6167 family protein [Actinomycetota bacterium]
MSRVLWVGVGAVVGVLVVRRASRVVHQYTPAGVADSLSSIGEGLRELATAVREGMNEREEELRYALGLDTQTLPEGERPDGDGIRTLLDDPAGPRAR